MASPLVEWRAGQHVWLPKEGGDAPFVAGQVTAVEPKGLKIRVGGAEQIFDPEKADVLPGNAPDTTAPDHCALINMNEPCVLENSRLRFVSDAIYTLVGTILIAINPFARIPIYGCAAVPSCQATHDRIHHSFLRSRVAYCRPDMMKQYDGKELGDSRVESHVYAMGEAA